MKKIKYVGKEALNPSVPEVLEVSDQLAEGLCFTAQWKEVKDETVEEEVEDESIEGEKKTKGIKLNLGCGDFRIEEEGFVNIDARELPTVDVVADITELPYDDNSIEFIYAGHILEHCEDWRKALTEWKRVLKPEGEIIITIPDIVKAISLYSLGMASEDLLKAIVRGGEDVTYHKDVWWGGRLATAMIEIGFREITPVLRCPYFVADVNWQTAIGGVK